MQRRSGRRSRFFKGGRLSAGTPGVRCFRSRKAFKGFRDGRLQDYLVGVLVSCRLVCDLKLPAGVRGAKSGQKSEENPLP